MSKEEKDTASIFFKTEVALLVWFSIHTIVIAILSIIFDAHPAVAAAAIGAPAYLLERWYKRNVDKYESKNKRYVQFIELEKGRK